MILTGTTSSESDSDALALPNTGDRPRAIIARTVKGRGIAHAEHNAAWHHSSRISAEEVASLRHGCRRCVRLRLTTIAELIEENGRVVFVGSDLGAGTMDDARDRHPLRVLMEGIAEQHLVGFAAGLALEGFVPYVHTIATFLTRRALEQIIVDVALHSLPVRLIGGGGGMTYAPLGPTHQAIDDFALMRTIPNMIVGAPS
jgi:deoxyxylulose-5-phosphate synthase